MQIASFFSDLYSPSLNPFSSMAGGHASVQPVSPVTRRDEGSVTQPHDAGEAAAPKLFPKDSANFSQAALLALEQETQDAAEQSALQRNPLRAEVDNASQVPSASTEELTQKETEQVRELKARDAEVRAHEAAHASAAGSLASGGPSYDYQRGPDGVNYAVGGEVGISLGTGSTPEERVANAAQAQRAANAPANPSGQDRAVAAQAAQIAASARAEIAKASAQASQQAQPEEATTRSPGAQEHGQPTQSTTQQAGAQAIQKSEQQDARKAQTLQMARRSEAYRDIAEATSGSFTAA
ncbi:MAG: hypothetical protein ACI9F9_002867 [Candidatus Paceibacteria bacterium]|jgi:hypothetical protein